MASAKPSHELSDSESDTINNDTEEEPIPDSQGGHQDEPIHDLTEKNQDLSQGSHEGEAFSDSQQTNASNKSFSDYIDTDDELNGGVGDAELSAHLDEVERKRKSPSQPEKKFKADTGNASKPSSAKKKVTTTQRKLHMYKSYSETDLENYRDGYPDKSDNKRLKDNLLFYTNKLRSTPDGDTIDNIHKHWSTNYRKLEAHHGYIQWLFPIRERGMNWQSQELQPHEAEAIKENRMAKGRVLKSYKMMLGFFGMTLEDPKSGKVVRSQNYQERYNNLNMRSHNYLRITRILKSLGELGYEHLKAPWIDFLIEEAFKTKKLSPVKSSLRNYWIETIMDDETRSELKAKMRTFGKGNL